MQDASAPAAQGSGITSASAVGALRAWCEMLRVSNLPTVASDCVAGVAIGMAVIELRNGPEASLKALSENPWLVASVSAGMCMLYLGGMALNAVVDRAVDARERPGRPVPSGRIPVRIALMAAIVLVLGGLWPSSLGRAPVPEIVAAAVAIWLSALAARSANPALRILAKGWVAVAAVAAVAWAVMPLAIPVGSDEARKLTENALAQRTLSMRMTYLPALCIALAAVAYNLLHARHAWTVLLLGACRALVPIAVAMSVIAPAGMLAAAYSGRVASGTLPSGMIVLCALPALALLVHTVALSLAARREIAPGSADVCSACGHPVAAGASISTCPECGASYAKAPPAPERSAGSRLGTGAAIVASLALPTAAALIAPRIDSSGALRSLQAAGAPSPWTAHAILLSTAIPAALFAIASVRGHAVAAGHATRRPAGVARLIAAIALLDAVICWSMGHPALGAGCLALYALTRSIQRLVPGS